MKKGKHPLSSYPEKDKTAFLSVIAVIASADNEVSDSEISNLRSVCKELELSPEGIGKVIEAAENPDSVPVKSYIEKLGTSDLRFTLITDMLHLAYADSTFSETEKTKIHTIAQTMGVGADQVNAMERYVKTVRKAMKNEKGTKDEWKNLGAEVAGGLASAGVPIVAVAASGSVVGLSAAGVTSGLAALGLGMGMVPGIGIAVAIGIASYIGVRALFKKLSGAK